MQEYEIIGNITKDLKLEYSKENKPYLVIPVAVKNKENDTTYINFVCFDKMAETHIKYLSKGDKVFIKGIIKNKVTEYQGKKTYGYTFYANQIKYLVSKNQIKKSEETIQDTINQVEHPVEEDPFKEFGDSIVISDDDLPF